MNEEKLSYPCISEKAWWTLRNQFKKTIPAEITDLYIQTLLGMQSKSSARGNILVPLRQINFIDENGKPTDLLYDYRLDDKYVEVCNKILEEVYPPELLGLFPDNEVDKAKATNYFMSKIRAGAGQAGKLAAFFALLKSGRIGETSKTTSKSKNKNKKIDDKRNIQQKAISQQQNFHKEEVTLNSVTPKTKEGMSVHIDLQIHISPEADAEQIDHIFESIGKHLYKE